MKYFILFCAVLFMLGTGLFSCKKNSDKNVNSDKINVTTVIFAPYDFARQIAGDKANVSMLLPPASESHSFEPSPKDIIKIQNSSVFIYVGGESDEWVSGILESIDTSKMKIITLIDCVDKFEEEIVEGMQEEEEKEEGGEEEAEYDEHVWTSPKNVKLIVQKIASALSEADPANAAYYNQNAEKYISELDLLDGEFQNVVNKAKRKTIVFADRFPFRYFTEAYGLQYFAAFPGCSTETEASAATIKFLIDKIKAEKIPVVFHIELSNEKMANAILEATGAKSMLLHSAHNISKVDFEKGTTYLDLMKQNVLNLKEALE
ncbi:MAG: metal ABC transporter substrate-binding protein [Endomicrobium sp.]|jgi:zinc transport system substrate-binding protein|nr:metal ABC transporter substrate-binding protein [Endomicrobium sp.]